MGIARTRVIALLSTKGVAIDVEASITHGTPGLHLIGLPDTILITETRDRVRAAIFNSDQDWPNRHVAVSLYPASLPKHGSSFDLAIAIAVLAATNAAPAPACAGMVLIGELGLDGRGRPVPAVLPAVLSAADIGATAMIVSQANAPEASLVPGIEVIAVASARLWGLSPPPHDGENAGERSLALVGPLGAGVTMLAERLPNLLPDLDQDACGPGRQRHPDKRGHHHGLPPVGWLQRTASELNQTNPSSLRSPDRGC